MMIDKEILLVDDHPLFRKGIRESISAWPGFNIAAEADNGESAIMLANIHHPDLVILDLALPDMSGLDVLTKLRSASPGIICIMMTLYNDTALVEKAVELGANGYLLKTDSIDVLRDCLDDLSRDSIFISPTIVTGRATRPILPVDAADKLSALSRREMGILRNIARNQTSKEIAAELGLSIRTIQNHRQRMARKLGLSGANGLLQFAIENKRHF